MYRAFMLSDLESDFRDTVLCDSKKRLEVEEEQIDQIKRIVIDHILLGVFECHKNIGDTL